MGPVRGQNGAVAGAKTPFDLMHPRPTMGFDYPCGLFPPMMMAPPPQFSRGAAGIRGGKTASFPSYRGRGGRANRTHQVEHDKFD